MTNTATIEHDGKTYARQEAATRAAWLRSGMAGADRIAEGDDLARALGWLA